MPQSDMDVDVDGAKPASTEAKIPMGAAPALAWLTLAAAATHVLLGRAALRALNHDNIGDIPHTALLQLRDVSKFALNLAACAGIISLSAAFWSWVRPRPFIPTSMRISLAGFAGILLPTLVLATLLPVTRTSGLIVLFVTGAANAMAVAMSAGCLRWRAPRMAKVAFGMTGIASFFAFAATSLLVIASVTLWEQGHPLGMAMRRTGEVSYLLAVPLASLASMPWKTTRGRLGMALGAAAGALIFYGATIVWRERELYPTVVYGATHLELLVDALPMWTPTWVAIVLTLGGGAIAMPNATHRQLGAGSLFLLFAGYAPTTPATVLLMALGVLFLARSLVALSTLQAMTEANERSRPTDWDSLADETPPTHPPKPVVSASTPTTAAASPRSKASSNPPGALDDTIADDTQRAASVEPDNTTLPDNVAD